MKSKKKDLETTEPIETNEVVEQDEKAEETTPEETLTDNENATETTESVETAEITATDDTTAEAPATDKKAKAISVLKKIWNRYFIDAFTGMAQGLFCTLIAGTILEQVAKWCGGDSNSFAKALLVMANIAKLLMGAGIGVGIAHKLGAKPLVMFTAAATGLIGAFAVASGTGKPGIVETLITGADFTLAMSIPGSAAPGNPIGSYVLAVLTVEVAGLYAGKTKLDIVLVPLGMMILSLAGIFVAWPFIKFVDLIAQVLVLAIEAGTAVKVLVGILVAVVMGILLTMPTSSAAIWVAIATSNTALENPEVFAIAGGAAVAGCAAHMVGFAVSSFRENKWSGLISQGIGTSMLQIPNIMKKPVIMVPEIVASAVSGLVAVLLDLRCDELGGGMGTSGLVGLFGTIRASMGVIEDWKLGLGIVLCLFLIPAGVSLGVSELMRKYNVIKLGDQAL
ncbi:MAG: PTS sugar transporter subunit IIC [Clostridia bacterium]|nr:PTS sugar transporter subunit IIC [Clostridia bacterium]